MGADELVAAVRDYLAASTSVSDRARTVEAVVEEFYNHSKFNAPSGEGLDGRDGPERRALGKVLDLAREWSAETHNVDRAR